MQWKISPLGEDLFYKAGLWATWRNPETRELVSSFTMITCDPGSSKMSEIHNRMPVILNRAERRLWMHPQASQQQLIALLRPCSEDMYTIAEHSRKSLKPIKVKKGRPESPDTGMLF